MRFVRVFLSSVILHFIWDTNFTILPLPYFGDIKLVILGVIGWTITFRLIQAGRSQLNEARRLEVERLAAIERDDQIVVLLFVTADFITVFCRNMPCGMFSREANFIINPVILLLQNTPSGVLLQKFTPNKLFRTPVV